MLDHLNLNFPVITAMWFFLYETQASHSGLPATVQIRSMKDRE